MHLHDRIVNRCFNKQYDMRNLALSHICSRGICIHSIQICTAGMTYVACRAESIEPGSIYPDPPYQEAIWTTVLTCHTVNEIHLAEWPLPSNASYPPVERKAKVWSLQLRYPKRRHRAPPLELRTMHGSATFDCIILCLLFGHWRLLVDYIRIWIVSNRLPIHSE